MYKISTAQIWVDDQDEALAFYTQKLGMEVRSDVTLAEMGNFRWLTVGPAGQPDIAIVLMPIPRPARMDAETADQFWTLMAKGFEARSSSGRTTSGVVPAAQGPRPRVLGARGAALRNRLGLPRPSGTTSGSQVTMAGSEGLDRTGSPRRAGPRA
jgi:catechol 2,3-dioxygenase-like lactoylglutathione lyase family enzyme